MLSRPTTEQILLDSCRELMEGVLPTVTDETAQVKLIMLDTVLRNMAVRSAHEIAWMREETATIEAYVEDVIAADPADVAAVQAMARLAKAPRDDLNLDAVVEVYCRAGDALSAALEAAVGGRFVELTSRGEQLLRIRSERETEVMAGWSPTGR